MPGKAAIGGAGIFDSIVISGILAVLLSDVVGEIFERITSKIQSNKHEKFNKEFSRPDVEFGSLLNNEQDDREDNNRREENEN